MRSVNIDIPVAIAHNHSKLEMCIHEVRLEGMVSQNVDIPPSLYIKKYTN